MNNKSSYTGFRCIGGRPSVRTLDALHNITEAVIKLCDPQKYRTAATAAVVSGEMRVYIPANLNEGQIDAFFANLVTMRSFGNTTGEPVYASLEAGCAGRNEDGSAHNGFLVMDVIERVVIDLVNNDGTTRLTTPLVQFATRDQVIIG